MGRTSQCVYGWISGMIVNHQRCIEKMFLLMCVCGWISGTTVNHQWYGKTKRLRRSESTLLMCM